MRDFTNRIFDEIAVGATETVSRTLVLTSRIDSVRTRLASSGP